MAFDYDYSHRLDDIMAQIERDEAKEPPAPNLPEAGNAVTARFVFNNGTTSAVWPSTSHAGTTVSSGLNAMVHGNDSMIYQVPGGSTGFSLVSPTSGIVTMEYWKR